MRWLTDFFDNDHLKAVSANIWIRLCKFPSELKVFYRKQVGLDEPKTLRENWWSVFTDPFAMGCTKVVNNLLLNYIRDNETTLGTDEDSVEAISEGDVSTSIAGW